MKLSKEWLNSLRYEETKLGWQDGPTWRKPKEIDDMKKKELENKILNFRRSA